MDPNNYTELTNQPRNTFEESVEWVCNELETAARDLPSNVAATPNKVGMATSAACYACIARLRLQAASPLFNTDSPVSSEYTDIQCYMNYDKSRWGKVVEACKKVNGVPPILWSLHSLNLTIRSWNQVLGNIIIANLLIGSLNIRRKSFSFLILLLTVVGKESMQCGEIVRKMVSTG